MGEARAFAIALKANSRLHPRPGPSIAILRSAEGVRLIEDREVMGKIVIAP